jgi:hypothetical protein
LDPDTATEKPNESTKDEGLLRTAVGFVLQPLIVFVYTNAWLFGDVFVPTTIFCAVMPTDIPNSLYGWGPWRVTVGEVGHAPLLSTYMYAAP